MTYPEAIAIVGGATVTIVGISYTLIKLLWRNGHSGPICPIDAGDGIDRLIAAIDRTTAVLSDVRDKLIAQHYDHQSQTGSLTRLESSAAALHRRLDGVVPTREP